MSGDQQPYQTVKILDSAISKKEAGVIFNKQSIFLKYIFGCLQSLVEINWEVSGFVSQTESR